MIAVILLYTVRPNQSLWIGVLNGISWSLKPILAFPWFGDTRQRDKKGFPSRESQNRAVLCTALNFVELVCDYRGRGIAVFFVL